MLGWRHRYYVIFQSHKEPCERWLVEDSMKNRTNRRKCLMEGKILAYPHFLLPWFKILVESNVTKSSQTLLQLISLFPSTVTSMLLHLFPLLLMIQKIQNAKISKNFNHCILSNRVCIIPGPFSCQKPKNGIIKGPFSS